MPISRLESKEILKSPRRGLWKSAKAPFLRFLALVAVIVLFIGGLEGVFHIFGWGEPDSDRSLLVYQQIDFPLFSPVELANGQKIFRAQDPRLGSQQFSFEKGNKTYRVFFFGASVMKGLGYSPNISVSRFYKDYLQAQYPQIRIEVINTSLIGFSSEQIQHLIGHVRENYDPDLLVVYSGNNEFLEFHAGALMNQNSDPNHVKTKKLLNKTHLYRALNKRIQSTKGSRNIAKEMTEERFIRFAFSESELMGLLPMTPAEYEMVRKKVQNNLQGIIQNSGDTPLLLLTVASNLRWNDPDESVSDWESHYLKLRRAKLNKKEKKNRYARRKKVFALLEEERRQSYFDKSFRDLNRTHFRLGKMFETFGNYPRAKEEFEKARELDPKSRRFLISLNQNLLSLKEKSFSQKNLWVIDTEFVLSKNATHEIIGYEFFYDHIHFTPLGAQRLAEALSRFTVKRGLVSHRFPKKDSFARRFRYQKSIDRFEAEVHQQDFDFPQAQRWVGFNFDKGDLTLANPFKYYDSVLFLKSMVALGRKDPWIYAFLGNAYFHVLNEEESSLKYYRLALRHAPPDDWGLRGALLENIALLHQRRGEEKEASHLFALAETLRQKSKSEGKLAFDKKLISPN